VREAQQTVRNWVRGSTTEDVRGVEIAAGSLERLVSCQKDEE
jgi:hypothetical protein